MKAEAENQASSEAAASDPKQEARAMLEASSTIEEIEAATGLGRNQILGIKGSMAKAQKKLDKAQGEPDVSGKVDGEEETLVSDLRDEAKLTAAALNLGRNRNRLRQADPELYNVIHGSGQSEVNSPSRTLLDLEIARLVKAMREEETAHRNNGGGAEATETANLRKEIDVLREEMRRKDVETLKKETEKLAGEIGELRADLRHSTNSGSDLAVVVRETSNLIGKALEAPGVLRNYLLPNDGIIKDKKEAPVLAPATESSVLSELRKRGLVTKIIQRNS